MKVVFISAPVNSGARNQWERELNIRVAEEAFHELAWMYEVAPICVHMMERFMNDAIGGNKWMENDLAILGRCDAIVLAGEWKDSKGCLKEKAFAEKAGLKVFLYPEQTDELQHWAESRKGEEVQPEGVEPS